MSNEHPHQGVIEAVAYLSDAYAKVLCSLEALEEGRVPGDGPHVLRGVDATAAAAVCLETAADALMEPFGVANVLQTVEEYIAGRRVDPPWAVDLGWTNAPGNRALIVRAILDAALAAHQEEAEHVG